MSVNRLAGPLSSASVSIISKQISSTAKVQKKKYLKWKIFTNLSRAADKGEPIPTYADVDVELDVVDRNNKPPIWDRTVYGPIHIKENVFINTIVTSIKARLVKERKIYR